MYVKIHVGEKIGSFLARVFANLPRGIAVTEWQREDKFGPRNACINHFQARVLLISIIVRVT